MSTVFISYRRQDSDSAVSRLEKALRESLPDVEIFRDLGAIKAAKDWIDEVRNAIDRSDVVLVVMGQRWLGRDESGVPRIKDRDDVVRREVARALKADAGIVPVLVSNATMPSKKDLPANVRELRRRQAFRIREGHFDEDLRELADEIQDLIEERRAEEMTQEEADALLDEIDEAGGFEVLEGIYAGDFSVHGEWQCRIASKAAEQQPWFSLDGHATLEFYVSPGSGTFEGTWTGSQQFPIEGRWMLNMDPSPPNRILGLRLQGHADGVHRFDIEIPTEEQIGEIIGGTDSLGRSYALRLLERAEF